MDPTTQRMSTVEPSLASAMGTQCVACGTPLATDQRYCLECGEPNGQPRLSFADGRGPEAADTVARTVVSGPPPRSRGSTGTALIAGVGTLLLALGVGVEIGRSTDNGRTQAPSQPVRVVTLPGAGAATATPAPGASPTATATATATGKKGKSAAKPGASTKQPAAVKTPPPVVKVGSKGSGRGYKNGKFTGDFFGG